MLEYRIALLKFDAGITQTPTQIATDVEGQLNGLAADGWKILTITNLSDMNGPPTVAICEREAQHADRTDAPAPSSNVAGPGDRPDQLPSGSRGPEQPGPALRPSPFGEALANRQTAEGTEAEGSEVRPER